MSRPMLILVAACALLSLLAADVCSQTRNSKQANCQVVDDVELKKHFLNLEVCQHAGRPVFLPCREKGDQLTAIRNPLIPFVGTTAGVMDFFARELENNLKARRVLLVWLFDESKSMRARITALRKPMIRLYAQIGTRNGPGGGSPILQSVVASFGDTLHILAKPSDDAKVIAAALKKVPNAKKGKRNLYNALARTILRYKQLVARQKLKLIIFVGTDGAADDGQVLEQTLKFARSANASIYVLGRDGATATTAFPRWLQLDGLGPRRHQIPSGFGPYEQIRLVQQTRGVFWMPDAAVKNGKKRKPRYPLKTLREYRPDWRSRAEVLRSIFKSRFRKTIYDAARKINAAIPADGMSPISLEQSKRQKACSKRLSAAATLLSEIRTARKQLNDVAALRPKEESKRWRADYDLMRAQLDWHEVRLLQFCYVLDALKQPKPPLLKPEASHTALRIVPADTKLTLPNESQRKAFQMNKTDLKKRHATALAGLKRVAETHKNTPWAAMADWERKRSAGIQVKTIRGNESRQPPKSNR